MKNHQTGKTKISVRELECLCLLTNGNACKEVANKLCLRVQTVWSYINRMKERFDANNLPELVKKACHQGIV